MKTQNTKKNDRPTTYKADVASSATENSYGAIYHVDLNEEETATVQLHADCCGMALDAFIRKYLSHNSGMTVYDRSKPSKVAVVDATFARNVPKASMMRLERAAKLFGQGLLEFISESVNEAIAGSEDAMLVHPKTKELVGFDDVCDLLTRSREYTARTLREQREGITEWEEPATIWVKLDARATADVRRYAKETKLELTESDIASGAIIYSLKQAFADLDSASKHERSTHEGEMFSDDGWGYVEEDVYNTRQRRLGLEEWGEPPVEAAAQKGGEAL